MEAGGATPARKLPRKRGASPGRRTPKNGASLREGRMSMVTLAPMDGRLQLTVKSRPPGEALSAPASMSL
jgi:hypothetical protein